jgi:hypothetical protein
MFTLAVQVSLFRDYRSMDTPANIIQAGAFEAKFVAMRQVRSTAMNKDALLQPRVPARLLDHEVHCQLPAVSTTLRGGQV